MALTQRKRAFLTALEKGRGIIAYACKATKVPRSTYYKWMKIDGEFAERVRDISEVTIDTVESSLLNRIKKEDTTAIIFFLKTKGKERGYTERTEYVDKTNYVESFNDLVKAADKQNLEQEQKGTQKE